MSAPMELFPFVAGSYNSRSPKFDCQRTVNLYPEASGSGNSKSIAMLIGTPGCRKIATIGGSGEPVRGMIRFNNEISIVVTATSVWKVINTAGVISSSFLANFGLGSTPVSMASNGQIVMIVDGSSTFYVVNPVLGTVTPTTDPSFTGADVVYFIAGYFVFNKTGTQQYQITRLYSTTIDPLAFASAEGAPDLLISLIVDHKEIWLMGETTTEVHFNSGNADFPFEPIQGAFIEQGCAAKFSVAKMTDGSGSGTVIWLSANEQGQGMFVRSVGYQPKRISDHALEFEIATYSRIDDAIAYTYQQEGHSFYMCSFPTANKTWCYDTSTELWHQRAYLPVSPTTAIPTGAPMEAHLSTCQMFFSGRNIVNSRLDGTLYELDLDYYQDDTSIGLGAPLVAIRQCPHLSDSDSFQFFDELWLDMETGVGIASGQGSDPQLILEWSDDGGKTYPYSRFVPIGKIGERQVRARARRLGKSRDRVFRVTVSDPVKRVFLGAGTRRHAA